MIRCCKPQARGIARRNAILQAATELFLEQGFERTTLSDIVERSKGSRSTLYEHFGNKEGLLRAIIEDSAAQVRNQICFDSIPQDMTEQGLADLGLRFVRAVLAPQAVAVYRIVVNEGRWISGIADLFYQAGVQGLTACLTAWFQQAQHSGTVSDIPAAELTRMFVGIVLGDFHVRHTMGLAPNWSEDDLERHVHLSVKVFLAGLRR